LALVFARVSGAAGTLAFAFALGLGFGRSAEALVLPAALPVDFVRCSWRPSSVDSSLEPAVLRELTDDPALYLPGFRGVCALFCWGAGRPVVEVPTAWRSSCWEYSERLVDIERSI